MKTKLLTICLLLFTSQVFADNKNFTDSQIKQMIIQQSINSYPGRCPCPYHAASNGSRCGGRSAYSRSGGYSIICYEEDVDNAMVTIYREYLNK